ncbi:uncharacterized protein Z519_05610 [Cladophialophora bantiana CBS 173.52]|uniref:SCP domain-containing protein n=1 Tax=Cladophialophora bantiana (strain ATCC 10958 / CBS 173.52 / CDC B-1940 / NIH 8579) TaxID=1442370 RepID=A0A0D2IBW6_CLAB1|nr:uncharacterized protein Z519_05610 [Cladophialophora bantiana CBS 173.52]KIW94294.1 hypothetical protein Z519_05610 [Cladophialophora bantiana CBS 173.52]
MRPLVPLFLTAGATAQSISFVYTATFTETALEFVTFTTCPCPTSTTGLSTLQATTPVTTTTTTTTTTSTTLSGPILPSSDTITPASSTITSSPTSNALGSPISTLSTTTSSGIPVVTNDAYISAALRHHNIHRSNHSADPLVWSSSLADTARVIAETCIYGHNTNVNGGGYGQNIGAGYPATPLGIGQFITEGLYNGEVNNYVYYGMEPPLNTLSQWGHFTQIVWKSTNSVGCYTADCSSGGLANAGPPIPAYFTVCNYAPPGNVIGSFTANIGVSIGLATVYGDY